MADSVLDSQFLMKEKEKKRLSTYPSVSNILWSSLLNINVVLLKISHIFIRPSENPTPKY